MAANGFWEEKEACVDASCIFFRFFLLHYFYETYLIWRSMIETQEIQMLFMNVCAGNV